MLGRTWPRFALEALFLFAVAAVAGLLDLSIPGIVAVMVLAYAATVVLEWSASRRRAPAPEASPLVADATPAELVSERTVRAEPVAAEPIALDPEPEPEPEPELEPAAEPEPNRVVALPLPAQPQAWNLWEIERLLRDSPEHDPAREEEQNYLLMYLRDFASPDGILPVDFDALVRESFGELVAGRNA